MTRCFGDEDPLYAHYHDYEWAVPIHSDQKLFEVLSLEGAQAGLSFLTILKRREEYQKAFHHFLPKKVASMSDHELEMLLQESGIIKNRRKIFSVRQNALVFLNIQKEYGSFDNYLKLFFPKIKIGKWKKKSEVPCTSKEADALSKDLKKKGMAFVGPKIIYAFCQAVGLVNDHLINCKTYTVCRK